jgi:hypothetical protein
MFHGFLSQLRENPSLPVPMEWLTDDTMTTVVPEVSRIDRPGFATKREAADYLQNLLAPIDGKDLFRDVGLWSWLSFFYFDDVCPAKNGRRKPGASPRHILEPDVWTRRYRHLLASPLFVLKNLPNHNRLFLEAPLAEFGDVAEQFLSRFFLMRIPGVAQASEMLYFDPATNRPKAGLCPKWQNAKAGDLRNRLPTRVEQLSRTYDIQVLTGDQLLTLLGKEFAGWLRN